MRLAIEALANVIDYNHFVEVVSIEYETGNPATLYFRLVDLDQLDPETKRPLRYIPQAGTSVIVNFNYPSVPSQGSSYSTFRSLPNPATSGHGRQCQNPSPFTRPASQPFTQDLSIWAVLIYPQDQVAYGGITATLTLGATSFLMPSWSQFLFRSVGPQGQFFC